MRTLFDHRGNQVDAVGVHDLVTEGVLEIRGYGCHTDHGDADWGEHRHAGDKVGWVSRSLSFEPCCMKAYPLYREAP